MRTQRFFLSRSSKTQRKTSFSISLTNSKLTISLILVTKVCFLTSWLRIFLIKKWLKNFFTVTRGNIPQLKTVTMRCIVVQDTLLSIVVEMFFSARVVLYWPVTDILRSLLGELRMQKWPTWSGATSTKFCPILFYRLFFSQGMVEFI